MARNYVKSSSFVLDAADKAALRDFLRRKIPGLQAAAVKDVMIGVNKLQDGSFEARLTIHEKVDVANLADLPDGVSLITE